MDTIFPIKKPSGKALGPKIARRETSFTEIIMRSEAIDRPNTAEYSCLSDCLNRGRVMVFIDGANLFYATSQLGIEIDYIKLLSQLAAKGRLVHAFFYTGVDPTNDKQHGFLVWLRRSGFHVVTKELVQLPNGSKKANLDVEIAVDMLRLAEHCDTVVLVSGDGDFAYALNTIAYRGVRVEVVSLRSMTNDSLINVADCYIDLDAIKQDIQKRNSSCYLYASMTDSSP